MRLTAQTLRQKVANASNGADAAQKEKLPITRELSDASNAADAVLAESQGFEPWVLY